MNLSSHPARRLSRDHRVTILSRARYVGFVKESFIAGRPRWMGVIRLKVTLPHWNREHIVNVDRLTFWKYAQNLRGFADYSELTIKDAERFNKWIAVKRARILLTHESWRIGEHDLHRWAGDLLEVLDDGS